MLNQILLSVTFTMPGAGGGSDPTKGYIVVGVIAVIIIMLIVFNAIRSGKSGGSKSGSSKKPASPAATKRKFKKIAKQIGLSNDQIKILEEISEKHKVGSPASFLTSPKVFNIAMKKAIQEYESGAYSADIKDHYIMLLFNIKQKLDKRSGGVKKIATSRQLLPGKKLTITTSNGEKYSSHIVTNLKDYMCAAIPVKQDGTMARLNKWEPVKVSVLEKGDRGFYFDTKIAGHSTAKGTSCIMLQHSNSISSSKQRNFPRKELGKSCYFFKINVVTLTEGKNVVKKAVIDDTNRGRLGSVLEISAGGCSIKSSNYLNKGNLLRVDIDIEKKQTVSILGKIVNIRKVGPGTATMHIQFTKISKRNMNSINSYIYGIGERTSILDY